MMTRITVRKTYIHVHMIGWVCCTWIFGVERNGARIAVLFEAARENVKHGDTKQVPLPTLSLDHNMTTSRTVHSTPNMS